VGDLRVWVGESNGCEADDPRNARAPHLETHRVGVLIPELSLERGVVERQRDAVHHRRALRHGGHGAR
jgi:hypothetical protein